MCGVQYDGNVGAEERGWCPKRKREMGGRGKVLGRGVMKLYSQRRYCLFDLLLLYYC